LTRAIRKGHPLSGGGRQGRGVAVDAPPGHWLHALMVDPLARHLAEAGGDISLVLDGTGRLLDIHCKDQALQTAMRTLWRGHGFIDSVTPESRPKVQALLQAAAGAQQSQADSPPPPVSARQVNHPVDGAPDLPVLYTLFPLAAAPSTGQPRWLALGRDLRELVHLQRRLVDTQQAMERDYWRFRGAEARFRALFQTDSTPLMVVEAAGLKILETNPAAAELLPTNARPAGAMQLPACFSSADAERLQAAVASVRASGRHEALVLQAATSTPRRGAAPGRQTGATPPSAAATPVNVTITAFHSDDTPLLLVRLHPHAAHEAQRSATTTPGTAAEAATGEQLSAAARAYLHQASDALVFTDTSGRVLHANPSFARLAQLASAEQARGQPLARWLGSTGVELSVLLRQLRESGSAALFTTELRGALGQTAWVEIAANLLDDHASGAAVSCAWTLRDIGRRAGAANAGRLETRAEPVGLPASPQQLTQLVGRVPIKQIVAETAELIEKLAIEAALEMTHDNKAMAAQLLGLSRQSLYVKLRRFGMLAGSEEADTASTTEAAG
jgi:transcriptional regulator PpsR